jgi:hypothetical protein
MKRWRSRGVLYSIPVIGMMIILAWFGFISLTTARGQPVCFAKLRIASTPAVLRQGAWSYLQAERPTTLASQGVPGQSFNPTRPIDRRRVDHFLLSNPDCCKIHPVAVSESQPSRFLSQSYSHNVAYVEVNARSKFPVDYMDTYKVDACWDNLGD